MNPNRWKWYTWVTLGIAFMFGVLPAVLMLNSGFYPSPLAVPWIGMVISSAIVWFVLWLLHQIVLALTGKTPPPAAKPPQGQG